MGISRGFATTVFRPGDTEETVDGASQGGFSDVSNSLSIKTPPSMGILNLRVTQMAPRSPTSELLWENLGWDLIYQNSQAFTDIKTGKRLNWRVEV
jgi:hypothetical protein